MPDFSPLLQRLDEVAPLPPGEVARIVPLLREKMFPKGAYFVRAGEPSVSFAYVAEGLMRYFYIDEDGREFTRYFCRGGHFISTSDVYGRPSLYNLQALETARMILIDYTDWLALIDAAPVWGRITFFLKDKAMVVAEKRERSLMLDDALTRYLALLEDFPGIEDKVKQYDIASYLGITPVALSRIRGQSMRKKINMG